MKSLFSKPIGIDIGTSTIKMCELSKNKKNLASLVSFGQLETPKDHIRNGKIEGTKEIGAVIKRLVATSKSKRKSVYTSIWGSDTVVRKAVSHGVHDKEIIKDEASVHIPFDLDDVNLQCKSIKTSDEEYLMLFAVSKNTLVGYVETISNAGLNCDLVDTVGGALANCYTYNYDSQDGEVVAIADIGEQFTALAILRSGELSFCRDIDFGGYNYTTSMHSHFSGDGISIDEAESLKKTQPPASEIIPIIEESNRFFVELLSNYFDQYCSAQENTAISKLYLTGGSSLVHGLKEYIVRAFDESFEVEFFDPFRRIDYDEKTFSDEQIDELKPYASISLGLSLR